MFVFHRGIIWFTPGVSAGCFSCKHWLMHLNCFQLLAILSEKHASKSLWQERGQKVNGMFEMAKAMSSLHLFYSLCHTGGHVTALVARVTRKSRGAHKNILCHSFLLNDLFELPNLMKLRKELCCQDNWNNFGPRFMRLISQDFVVYVKVHNHNSVLLGHLEASNKVNLY